MTPNLYLETKKLMDSNNSERTLRHKVITWRTRPFLTAERAGNM